MSRRALSRSFLACAALTAVGLAPFACPAAALLEPQAVLTQKSVGNVALSPDGQWVAYRVSRPSEASEPRGAAVGEIWVLSSTGGTPTRIEDGGFSAGQPGWSPDGATLAWIARSQPGATAQIYVKPRAGGAAKQLTRADGDVVAFEWSHDGRRIGFVAWDAKSPQRVRDEAAGRDWVVMDEVLQHKRLHAVAVDSGASALITRMDMTVDQFDWSPDDSQFVLTAANSPSDDDHELALKIYTVPSSGGTARKVLDQHGRIAHPHWSPDGRSIAWLGSIAVNDPWAGSLFVMPATGGAPRNLMSGYDGTTIWLGRVPGRPRSLGVLLEEHLGNALRAIDLDTGRIEPLLVPSVILSGPPSFSRDGRTVAFAAHSPSHPTEAFVGRLGSGKTGEAKRITVSNPGLQALTLATQEVTRWKSKDGTEIEGLLLKPVGYQAGRRYPIVLHVHGGSEGISPNGWQADYHNFGQLLAARGYAVLYPNYRGSRGRGTNFVRGNRHDLMGREWEDIETALDHAIAMGIADGERAGIYGFSWGGYAAGWGATFASHRFKAAVGGAGIYNWISEAGTNDTRMHEQLAHWDSPLYDDFLLYLDRSPIYHIAKARTPLLLLHGEMDPSCPIGQAIEMHTALKWKGTPVELVAYPREGHGMSEPAHQEDFLMRGLGWLDRYLKP